MCIDCNARDFIMPLVVICQDNDADKIKAAMLKWDNKIREEYYQELTEETALYNFLQNLKIKKHTISSFYCIV